MRDSILKMFFALLFIAVTYSCNSKADTIFELLTSGQTHIDFKNQLLTRDEFGILYYIYYYNGGGVATGDINNDGLTDIYFTANDLGKNKLYLNKGNFVFEDITAQAGVAGISDWCTGVTMADVNGDGYLDIYVSAVNNVFGLKGHNELFINNGKPGKISFRESSAEYGLDFSGFSTQAAFFDYDRDGDLDCYLLNQSFRPHEKIIDTSYRRKPDQYAGDRLYRNELSAGKAIFTEVTQSAGIYQSGLGYGLGLAIADLNNDGWDDIYIGNDFHENDYYYVNNGNGSFTESGAEAFRHYSRFSMGNDIADYNNDGHLDIITADMLPQDEKVLKTYGSDENPDNYKQKIVDNGYQYQYSKNCLQRNNGNGSSFSETALLSGVSATDWSWSPLFADFDNDGKKDLFISSGIVKRPVDLDFVKYVSNLFVSRSPNSSEKYDAMALDKMPDGSSHPYLYKGDGYLHFEDVSKSWGTAGMKGYFNGASYADLDNDGKLDLVINSINAEAVIMKNNAAATNYITVSFKGDNLNTKGIGCKAYVFQKEKQQFQQLMLTRGFQSSSEARLHFGLGSEPIDSVLVIWPDQSYQVLKNVPSNKLLEVAKKDASGKFDHAIYFKPPNELLSPLTDVAEWKHQENNFSDFNIQYLLPHAESTRGPKLAVADIDRDGDDDFFACGAKGQAGVLMIQQKNGSFAKADSVLFAADANCEDVDAVFFDANGDRFPDLFVVSGGNEYTGNSPFLPDRLYMNDGKGHFTRSADALPNAFINKSCVAVADIDHDGDPDIFCGVLADSRAFGIPQASYLLINDGKGKFSPASPGIISLSALGAVTAAQFADLNNDSRPDLVVAGEWMPLTVFMNRNGKFEKTIIPGSDGLWQSLFVDDVNGDGYMDFLAGNWGLNNKFHSGKNGPLRLYVSDFDGNGSVDHLLSYMVNNIEYPFLPKDEVERPLPLLKKHYLYYADYAGVPMKDVFYGWVDTVKPVQALRLASAVCLGSANGNFTLADLPADLQLAPIMTFQKIGPDENVYLAGGNFYDVIPYEGRYDAQPLALLSVNKSSNLRYIHQPGLLSVKGQVRDAKWIRVTGKGDVLMVARNKDGLLFFTKRKNA